MVCVCAFHSFIKKHTTKPQRPWFTHTHTSKEERPFSKFEWPLVVCVLVVVVPLETERTCYFFHFQYGHTTSTCPIHIPINDQEKKIVNFFSHLSPLALIIIIIIVVCCCWQQQMKDWIKFLMIGDWWPLTIREYFCKIFFHELWLIIMMTCITTKTMMVIGLKSKKKKKNSLLVLIMLMLVMMR